MASQMDVVDDPSPRSRQIHTGYEKKKRQPFTRRIGKYNTPRFPNSVMTQLYDTRDMPDETDHEQMVDVIESVVEDVLEGYDTQSFSQKWSYQDGSTTSGEKVRAIKPERLHDGGTKAFDMYVPENKDCNVVIRYKTQGRIGFFRGVDWLQEDVETAVDEVYDRLNA